MEECSLCTSDNYLYPLECPGNHSYCLSCIKGLCLSSSPTAIVRVQCPECRYTPSKKHLKVLCEDPSKVKKIPHDVLTEQVHNKRYIWIYEGRNNGWWYYDYEMQDILENAFIKNEFFLNWVTCGQKICIDFTNMIQTNIDNGAVRSIKRLSPQEIIKEQILVKGVAGMTS